MSEKTVEKTAAKATSAAKAEKTAKKATRSSAARAEKPAAKAEKPAKKAASRLPEWARVNEDEVPLARLVPDGGMTAIFRSIGFIGDSLSSGEMQIRDKADPEKWAYYDYYEFSWGQFIARKCGLTARNFSRGGLTAKTFNDYAWSVNAYSPDNACSAYVIALGANDTWRTKEYELGMGSMDDIDESDPAKNKDSFVGWYDRIIRSVRKIAPGCPIFMITLPRGEDPEPENRERQAEIVRSFAERYEKAYVIDLRKYGPVYDSEFLNLYFLNGHMNVMGYKLTADMVASYIDYIIMHNPDDFRESAFIGKRVL